MYIDLLGSFDALRACMCACVHVCVCEGGYSISFFTAIDPFPEM